MLVALRLCHRVQPKALWMCYRDLSGYFHRMADVHRMRTAQWRVLLFSTKSWATASSLYLQGGCLSEVE